MSNYIEYKDKMAFHPGFYIKKYIDEIGITQEDFAKRLDTTPKNLSLLVRGKQSLSVDMAMKLSKMLGTSAQYWLNLQSAYDTVLAEMASDEALAREKAVLRDLGYGYFREHCGLPDLPRKLDEQVAQVRSFLGVASLTVLTNRDMTVSFRSAAQGLSEQTVVKANAMVQIAINEALKTDAPKYDGPGFEKAIEFALTQTRNHAGFYPLVRERFLESGVVLVALPNLKGSKTNGATKKLGDSVMLMVNDRRRYTDTFWFTLLHEAGHVINGDFGVSFEGESDEAEMLADAYAADMLVDPAAYSAFVREGLFTPDSVRAFADEIDRDPGIVLGRLENDGHVVRGNPAFRGMRGWYAISLGE